MQPPRRAQTLSPAVHGELEEHAPNHARHGYFGMVPVDDAGGDWREMDALRYIRTWSSESPTMSGLQQDLQRKKSMEEMASRASAPAALDAAAATGHSDEDQETNGETANTNTDSSSSDTMSVGGGGMHEWCPGLYNWIQARTTTRVKLTMIVLFVVLDGARFVMFEYATLDTVNTVSIFVVADGLSLVIALCLSFGIEGGWAFEKIFGWHGLWRFLSVSVLFVAASGLTTAAYRTGLSPSLITMLGKLYLPISAAASLFAFNRKYGKLEWLALSMLMLAIAAFILLRDRCHWNGCKTFDWQGDSESFPGILLMLFSICCGAVASLLTERIYKDRSVGILRARHGRDNENRYYIYRAQMGIWTTLLWLVLWFCQVWSTLGDNATLNEFGFIGVSGEDSKRRWFGTWTKRQYFLVAIISAQSWFAGLTVQHYSTVSKGVAASLSTVLVVIITDPIFGKYNFGIRVVPSLLITIIVVLSALIFQTGRINVKNIRAQLHRSASVHIARPHQVVKEVAHRIKAFKTKDLSLQSTLMKYSIVIMYVLADTFRSVLLYVVQANRYFVPQTMALMSAVTGCAFASFMTFNSFGFDGLRKAWEPRKVCKFLVCGGLQAMTTSLSSMAYALGTSPALVVALGKVYTPMVAVFSRCILGKFFMWLEWFALIILTAASFCFGLMDGIGNEKSGDTSWAGMLCVIASATTSCLMSLAMERILKSESDPFIMQKVRLDFGSILFSIIGLPLLGMLATMPGNNRTDLAYWVDRPGPDYWACNAIAVDEPHNSAKGCNQHTHEFMVDWAKVGNSSALVEQAKECVCGSGVFLGWDNWMIYVAMLVVVFHSWITGVLVTRFSSVYRAVADGIPVLLIYFLLDPLASRVPMDVFKSAYNNGPLPWPPPDWSRNAICLILPLSGTTFSSASSEMHRALSACSTTTSERFSDSHDVEDAGEVDGGDALTDSESDGDLEQEDSLGSSLKSNVE